MVPILIAALPAPIGSEPPQPVKGLPAGLPLANRTAEHKEFGISYYEKQTEIGVVKNLYDKKCI